MTKHQPESDWKVFRSLNELALERFCEQVLNEIKRACDASEKTWHERYGSVYGLVEERDKLLASMFDGFSRSTAFWKIAVMWKRGLIHDDELQPLTQETLKRLRSLGEWNQEA
jgi:hypothetical protein